MTRVPYWRLSGWYFFYFGFVGCFTPYFGLYLKAHGFDAWRIGIVMAAMPLMRMLAPALWGLLADRFGHKARLVRGAMTVSAFAFSGFLLADSFVAMIIVMLVMSFFWSAALPLVEALTLRHLSHAPERYGRVRLWGSVGFIATVQGTGVALDMWQPSIVVWLSLALLGATSAISFAIPEDVTTPHRAHGGERMRDALARPVVMAIMLGGMLMSVAHAPLYTFLSIHLVDHGYSKGAVGALWSLGVCAEIVVFAFMPRLLGVCSLRMLLMACFGLAAVRFALIGWAAQFALVIVFAQLLHAASFGAHHAASVTALNRWFAPQRQGVVQALFGSISYGAGGIIGGVLGGYSWDRYGAGVTYTGASIAAGLGFMLIARGLRGAK